MKFLNKTKSSLIKSTLKHFRIKEAISEMPDYTVNFI